jgi:hypothetical protein
MTRTPSWQLDPDIYALQSLTQALELGKKILKDRIDKIPDVRCQGMAAADRDSWSLSLQNHAQWNPKVNQTLSYDNCNDFSADPFVFYSIVLGANW